MEHTTHSGHAHEHGTACSHPKVRHAGHTDYLHDGHLHFAHDGHVDEHVVEASAVNPETCTTGHSCGGHEAAHKHAKGCGHEAVPHASHTDYIVAGHMHRHHDSHCDDHGPLSVA